MSKSLPGRFAREDLDHSVSAATDDPSPVLAPDDTADTFAAHQSITRYLLIAAAFLE